MLGDPGHLRLRLLERHAGLQTRKHVEIVAAAIFAFGGSHGQGNPELIVKVGKLESRRHHPYDFIALAVEKKFLAEDLRFGSKLTPPQTVAEYGDMRSSGAVFPWGKSAAVRLKLRLR